MSDISKIKVGDIIYNIKDEEVRNALLNYLAKNNIEEFTPTGDYNPATKKYVDDNSLWEKGVGVNSIQTKGTGAIANGEKSVAQGLNTVANSKYSHVEGYASKTIIDPDDIDGLGQASHAEGTGTTAKGTSSHAEGGGTLAIGRDSHTEGNSTTTGGPASHAEGNWTITNNLAEHAEGTFNKSNMASNTFGDPGNTLHSVGIGRSTGELEDDRKNAWEIMQNGDAYLLDIGGFDGTNPLEAETVQNVINNMEDDVDEVVDDMSEIKSLIPNQATSSNKLADKDFVNSSIATNTAHYIYKIVGTKKLPFDSVAELEAYTGTVTQNDYAFVTGTDSEGNTYFDRYKADVVESTVTWAKEYRLNNSSFTAEQWAAITSGITQALVTLIGTNRDNIATILADYIKSIDYGTSDKAGLVREAEGFNINPNNTGAAYAATYTFEQIEGLDNSRFIGKGTLYNVLVGKGLVKATSISSSSTDDNVVTPKAVYDYIQSLDGNEVVY